MSEVDISQNSFVSFPASPRSAAGASPGGRSARADAASPNTQALLAAAAAASAAAPDETDEDAKLFECSSTARHTSAAVEAARSFANSPHTRGTRRHNVISRGVKPGQTTRVRGRNGRKYKTRLRASSGSL